VLIAESAQERRREPEQLLPTCVEVLSRVEPGPPSPHHSGDCAPLCACRSLAQVPASTAQPRVNVMTVADCYHVHRRGDDRGNAGQARGRNSSARSGRMWVAPAGGRKERGSPAGPPWCLLPLRSGRRDSNPLSAPPSALSASGMAGWMRCAGRRRVGLLRMHEGTPE